MAEDAAPEKKPCHFGFGGVHGGVFQPPPFVDLSKPPGYTSLESELGLVKALKGYVTLQSFFWSPNSIWCLIFVALYLGNPYQIEKFKDGYSFDVFLQRLAVNYCFCFMYYGFFFVALYQLAWSKRKFRSGYMPTRANMAHNIWYWSLAILQWTVWECVMMRLWATGTVTYVSDQELLNDPLQMVLTAVLVIAAPIYRDWHFYTAHRFIHIRAIYKYVHSLHHRNADPEPFSGMCMHPVEHLYYFSNAFLPTLLFPCSPAIFMWIFVHLAYSPGASHSGWEDHWQSDQLHWLHHNKFECNYGAPGSAAIDIYNGTFREKIGDSQMYRGEWADQTGTLLGKAEAEAAVPDRPWSSQGVLGWQKDDHLAYTLSYVAMWLFGAWALLGNRGSDRLDAIAGLPIAKIAGALVAAGPVLSALIICAASGDPMSIRWPFQNERMFGIFGILTAAATCVCVMPMYFATSWAAGIV